MVALRFASTVLVASALALLPTGAQSRPLAADKASLFAQASAEKLNRDFAGAEISYLLLDVDSVRVIAARWKDADAPIPMGSLVKPFTALAYGEQNGLKFPQYVCRGSASGCWLPKGHGRTGVVSALAQSCNSYFQTLASTLSVEQVSATAARFGLEPPPQSATSEAFVGMGSQWLNAPLKMANAYLELHRRRSEPGVSLVVAGLAESGRRGTGAWVDRELIYSDALVKTGTAPCTHPKRAPGDGLAVALAPADHPKVLLLVRVHGIPGAQAAKVAGNMLRVLEE